MQKNIKYVIFDLDGTLLDTLDDLKDSVNHVMEHYGYPTHDREHIRIFVGNGIRKLIERAIPAGCENPHFEEAFTMFKMYYQGHCIVNTKPYEGIMELVDSLIDKNIGVGIVSNKNQEALQELCNHFFADKVSVVIGQREGIPKKPAPDSVYAAMQQLSGCKIDKAISEQTIYVGDSDVDAQTAINACLECVLVDWGFRDKDLLQQQKAIAVINRPSQLLELI